MVQISPHLVKIAGHVGQLIEDCSSEPAPSAASGTNLPTLRSLDLNQIKDGVLLISVPLTSGEYEFPGLFKPAQVKVTQDTTAWLSVKLNQNPKGKTCISQLMITLSKPVVVCNPSTAYEKDGNGFRDLFASVHISGIEIDSEGRVLFQGHMRKGFSTNDIKEDFKPEMFPKIQLELESLLKPQKDKDSETDYNSIHDMLVKLGAVLGEAKCSLKCRAQNGSVELHTKVTLNSKGLMTLAADSQYSSGIEISGQQIRLSPELNISGINMLKPKATGFIDINAEIGMMAKFGSRIEVKKNKPSGFQAFFELLFKQPDLKAKFQITTSSLQQGDITYTLHPAAFNILSRSLKYKFFSNGKLAIRPSSSGIAQFLSPETQFVPRAENLLPSSKLAVGQLNTLEWRQRAEELGGTKIYSGNRARLLIDGINSMPARIRLIESAENSICLQTLIFRDDHSGMAIAKALVSAKNRGVAVHVICDRFGEVDSIDDLFKENKALSLMKQSGIRLEVYSNNSFLGVQKILPILKSYKLIGNATHIANLLDSDSIISTLNLAARICLSKLSIQISDEDKETLKEGLSLILGKTRESEILIERLSTVSSQNPLKNEEILRILKASLNINERWHEKYLIVDGKHAILGGLNIADEYLLGGSGAQVLTSGVSRPAWRDTDILIEGPAAHEAYKRFADNWSTLGAEDLPNLKTAESFPESIDIQILQSRPVFSTCHSITNLKVEAINRLHSGDKLFEASAYFVPVGGLCHFVEALKNAAQRGVDVRILTNGIESTDLPQVNRAAMVTSYRELLASGVRIFERLGKQTMHQKVASYGTQVSMVGSYNLDNRSASLNSESVAVIHNEEFTKQVEDMILRDMEPEKARELFLPQIESLPISEELQNSAWAMLAELM